MRRAKDNEAGSSPALTSALPPRLPAADCVAALDQASKQFVFIE